MARRKRTSLIEDLLELSFEFTSFFWQIGAMITCLLFIGGLYSVDTLIINYSPPTELIAKIIKNIPWVIYLLPMLLFLLCFVFGVATYSAYKKQNL
ncbi:hypothetical protein [Methylotuvimicrobium buryatense]|uniref:hypothetical protein n=1 Tax=Methylotuvimicrobium buryatense TaxID=95641 RepID=UPI001181B22B|nr:hypothetical protein [Methylotuvimicrobium buryatense]